MNHRPRKRFGQNFLHDPGIIGKILRAIHPLPGEHLVEIGPGQGAITKELLRAAGALDAVELDRDLLPILQAECGPLGDFRLHNADALKFDFAALRNDERPLRLVGNLPYNISTPILFHLLEAKEAVADMHFMLQKEVVDRMAAEPGSKTYGRLSVMLQVQCQVTPLFDIGPGAFNPPPKVDSAFVRLTPYRPARYDINDMENLGHLVKQAFSQRRKTLRNTLKGLVTTEQFQTAGIDPGLRAEQLAPGDYVRLSNLQGGI